MKKAKSKNISDDDLIAWNDKLDDRLAKGKALIDKLRPHIIDTPEGRLWFGVFHQAIIDLTIYDERLEACQYFKRERFACLEMAGINNAYAKRAIKSIKLDYSMP